MIIENLITIGRRYIWLWLFLGAAIHFARNRWAGGTRHIPGPLLAKFTNLWRLYNVSKGNNHVSLNELHRKYGDNVRYGPKAVSIRSLSDIKTVYGIKAGYVKSEFYAVQKQMAKGKPTSTLFTSLDETFHANIKRPVANAYSMTTLTEFEPFVDSTIDLFFTQLENRYVGTGKPCPLFEWLQFYAFDVIGELTCSHTLGFLRGGSDIEGMIEGLNKTMDYNAMVGQMPWLDQWLVKNPLRRFLTQSTGPVARFARERLDERLRETKVGGPVTSRRDFASRFLAAKTTHPEIVNDNQVFSYMITNIFAGSDTTAISLRAIIYYIVKNPSVYEKLMNELVDAQAKVNLTIPTTWKQSQELEYFDAVVKEALRMHPAVGLPLERIVPKEGLQLESGIKLPQGTIVGASPWVVHRDERIFGENVDVFRPERWLQGDESKAQYEQRYQHMVRATMTFGMGPRTCIGKNISLLEIYKLLPSFLLKYQVELTDPKANWKLKNSWFVRQEGVEFYLNHRTT